MYIYIYILIFVCKNIEQGCSLTSKELQRESSNLILYFMLLFGYWFITADYWFAADYLLYQAETRVNNQSVILNLKFQKVIVSLPHLLLQFPSSFLLSPSPQLLPSSYPFLSPLLTAWPNKQLHEKSMEELRRKKVLRKMSLLL